MAKGKKGLLTSSGEWAKHLRRFGKKEFWKSERQAQKKLEKSEIDTKSQKSVESVNKNQIILKPTNPESFSDISVSYSIGRSRITDYYEILVIKYEGKYGLGSAGNGDAQYMYAKGEYGLNSYEPQGAVLDLTNLEYEWGDMIDMVFNIGDEVHREFDFPMAILVGEGCKEALGTLFHGIDSKESPCTKEGVFNSFQDAWKYVENKIENEKAHSKF